MSASVTMNHRREPATMREHITSSSLFSPPGGRLARVLMLAGLASTAPACGDGPICASDISVFITTPGDGSSLVDGDEVFGVQSDVVVRTSLHPGELVELRVRDESGQEQRVTTEADAVGTALFSSLTLPPGNVTLEATGTTAQCGSGQDTIEIFVGFGTSCALEVGTQPVPSSFYAPLPVLSSEHDWNPLVDGLQASFAVWTAPGYIVELFTVNLDDGLSTSAGTRTADGFGLASYTMTLPEGALAVEARCRSLDQSINTVSNRISAYVDSQRPTCSLLSPVFGDLLTPALDIDGNPANGTQIELVGAVVDDDASGVAPLAPLFAVNTVSFEGSAVDLDGTSRVIVTLDEDGPYVLGIQTEDRAGNECAELWSFNYQSTDTPVQMQVVSRQSVRLSWTAPASDELGTPASEYQVRVSDEPLDELDFDFTGFPVDGAPVPAAPGTPESMLIEGLAPGTSYYAAVMAVDAFGARRFLGAAGPVMPRFDVTDVDPVAPEDGDNGLGYAVAAGDFNDDGYSDVAVSAPFKSVNGQSGAGTVYVYFGGPDGVRETPDVTIEGNAANEQLGNGLTAIRWDDDDIDDLAVGTPGANGFGGRILVFLGGSSFTGGGSADADITIDSSAAAGDWFASSGLGFALARARFDSDARDDLVITAPGGGDGNGGVVVLYGGATSASIVLSSQSAAGSGDAVALVLEDPDPGSIFNDPLAPFFGHYVFSLGPTQGAGDDDDDIGVAYTEKNAAVVFRGRPRPASPGVTVSGFDPALDLEIQRTSSTDTSSRFGTSMGTIADLNGDGAREIVVGMWRDGNNIGRVEIYDGDRVGVQNASLIRLRSISPLSGQCTSNCGVGSAVVNNAAGLLGPDVDNDGIEDLMIVTGMDKAEVSMRVWFGSQFPGTPDIDIESAHHVINAPPELVAGAIGDSDGTPITATWVGDVNGDGLEDIFWADWSASGRDGVFLVLY